MTKEYIEVPKYTTIKEILNKNYSLSATQYKTFCIKNKNQKTLGEFLDRPLIREDLGNEVGSESYIDKSGYRFLKTKALQEGTFLIDIDDESLQYITPKNFIDSNLKKGDIIISKDSNVGEIAILEKDYENTMLCGGIYKLPISKHKFYVLAFVKSNLFRQQIDFLIPRGSTIRHGKTKFLECKIPIPNLKSEQTIEYVEILMKAICNKETEIKRKFNLILNEIDNELSLNQGNTQFRYSLPTISEIESLDRMDSSMYSKEFKEKEFKITNYKYGYTSLTDLGFEGIRGTSLESNYIKNRIDSDVYHKGFYELVIPTNISKYGTIIKSSFIGTPVKLKTISQGDIIFGGEGFGKGKSFVVIDESNNIATNYHGIRIVSHNNYDIYKKIFIKCFLSYLREFKLIDKYGVGGNGGHLSPAYFYLLKIPNFPDEIEKNIGKLYYNNLEYSGNKYNISNFLDYDNEFNKNAGIYDLDCSMKYLKEKLNTAIENIADDIEVEIKF